MIDIQPAVAVISTLNDTVQRLKNAATSDTVNEDAREAVMHELEFLKHVQTRADALANNVAQGKNRLGIGDCGIAPCEMLSLSAQDFRSTLLNKTLTVDQRVLTSDIANDIDLVAHSARKLVNALKPA
jgi:hypothetical protein